MYRHAIKLLKFPLIASGAGSTAYAYTHYKPVDIVWDLDHTLVHTIKNGEKNRVEQLPPPVEIILDVDRMVTPKEEVQAEKELVTPDFEIGTENARYAYMRPGAYYVVKFFSFFGGNQYVFTAATKNYADTIVKKSGIHDMMSGIIAREDVPIKKLDKTYATEGNARLATIRLYGKDITLFNCNRVRTILVDDARYSHKGHENTGILIPAYNVQNRLYDDTLFGVAWIIFKCFFTDDVESVISNSEYSVNKK
jgi:hypothetical protein